MEPSTSAVSRALPRPRGQLARASVGVALVMLLASCLSPGQYTITADSAPAAAASPVPPQTDPTPVPPQPDPTAEPTWEPPTIAMDDDGNNDPATGTSPGVAEAVDEDEALRTVLVVTTTLPRGTSVAELVEAPTVFLSARGVPESFVSDSAITSISELQELAGLVVGAGVEPGDILLRSHFVDQTFSSTEARDQVLAEHVLVLAPGRAVGGYLRVGDLISVVATSPGPDGQTSSTTVLRHGEVLQAETLLPEDATATEFQAQIAVTIAVTSDEKARLSAEIADSALITIAAEWTRDHEVTMVIEISEKRSLESGVMDGDVVNIVAGTGVVATDVEVLNVDASYRADSLHSLLVTIDDSQLLALTSALADGPVSLVKQ